MAIIKRLSQVLVDRRHQSYVDHSYELKNDTLCL
jgi:hypothetical protein